MGRDGRLQLQVREADSGVKVDRAHEVNARSWLSQLVGVRLNGNGAIAVAIAGLTCAVLDMAQAIREGNDSA